MSKDQDVPSRLEICTSRSPFCYPIRHGLSRARNLYYQPSVEDELTRHSRVDRKRQRVNRIWVTGLRRKGDVRRNGTSKVAKNLIIDRTGNIVFPRNLARNRTLLVGICAIDTSLDKVVRTPLRNT
jgi:hypothetical protein